MFSDFCETYLNRQYFYVSLGKKIAYFHMTAILMARELSSIIGSYCIELIDLRWHGTP